MPRTIVCLVLVAAAALGLAVAYFPRGETHVPKEFPILSPEEIGSATPADNEDSATFGSGCFWCTEAVFQQMKGVRKVVSGYSGGVSPNPTYREVCNGDTGHAEVVQVTFDPAVISYPDLLEVFWRSHDPTTPNRQGNDVGTQYRSVIFYHSERQRELAERYKEKIDAAGVYALPVVTEIAPFTAFYPAEDYHQNYFANNPRQPYCSALIGPKLEKLRKVFQGRMNGD